MTHAVIDMARWFIARSDIESALKLIYSYEREETDEGEWLVKYIHRHWPLYFSEEEYRRVYRESGIVECEFDAFDQVPLQGRFAHLKSVVSILTNDVNTVLDFGCSRGFHSIHLHNQLGKKWTGIDIDKMSIKEARKAANRYAKRPEDFEFIVGDESFELSEGKYDLAMGLEILEHVKNPLELIRKLEKAVKDDGYLIFTVPHGPIELSMWVEHPERNREHIREFLFADILDIFGNRPSLGVSYLTYPEDKYMGLKIGSFTIAYRKDGNYIGEIDWSRKLALWNAPKVILPD